MQKQKFGTLRLIRPRAYLGMIRGLVIRINGEKVGDVRNNGLFEIDLQAGDYRVTVHMDWCRSQPFEFHMNDGQVITLRAELNNGLFGAIVNSFFNWHNLYVLVPDNKKKRKNDEL